MALKDIVKVSRKTYFNPRAWLGYNSLKSQTIFLLQFFKQLFGPLFSTAQSEHAETFEEAMIRLSLTEQDIAKTSQVYFLLAVFFVLVGIGVLALLINYLLGWHIAATLVSLGIAVFMFSQAFRFHFWYFQIKHRKLGCTFEEWYHGKPNHGDDHHA